MKVNSENLELSQLSEVVEKKVLELLPYRKSFRIFIDVFLQSTDNGSSMLLNFFEEWNNKIYDFGKKEEYMNDYQLEAAYFLLHEFFIFLNSKLIEFERW